jgi:hypothetical protein
MDRVWLVGSKVLSKDPFHIQMGLDEQMDLMEYDRLQSFK